MVGCKEEKRKQIRRCAYICWSGGRDMTEEEGLGLESGE
jgi:hypothetical protein